MKGDDRPQPRVRGKGEIGGGGGGGREGGGGGHTLMKRMWEGSTTSNQSPLVEGGEPTGGCPPVGERGKDPQMAIHL